MEARALYRALLAIRRPHARRHLALVTFVHPTCLHSLPFTAHMAFQGIVTDLQQVNLHTHTHTHRTGRIRGDSYYRNVSQSLIFFNRMWLSPSTRPRPWILALSRQEIVTDLQQVILTCTHTHTHTHRTGRIRGDNYYMRLPCTHPCIYTCTHTNMHVQMFTNYAYTSQLKLTECAFFLRSATII